MTALLALVATTGCLHVYHADYHPEVWRSIVQNVSYQVTVVQETPKVADGGAPHGSTPALRPAARQAAAISPRSPSVSAPDASLPSPAADSPPGIEVARHDAPSVAPAPERRESMVSETRMGLPVADRGADCPLELIDATGLPLLRYAQVGIVQVMQAPYGTDPLDPSLRDLVRPRACALGGFQVSLMSSGSVDPPHAHEYASSYAVYAVWRERSLGELLSQL